MPGPFYITNMGLLITTSDFTGKWTIPQTAFSTLDQFITDTEEGYLIDMLGAEFATAFIANVNGTTKQPTDSGYLKIYNSFSADYGSKVYVSKGMKAMLKGFIYFDYMRNAAFKATVNGMTTSAPDTSKQATPANLYSYLNEAITSFQSIQAYVASIHPEYYTVHFNGQEMGLGISILN